MARPTTITDEELLAATRAALREHGVATTTAEVAQRAGVSEGTLFHRFGSKQALFRAALQSVQPSWVDELDARVGKGDVFAQLEEIAHQVLAFFDEMMPMMLLVAGSDQHEAGQQRTMTHAITGKQQSERRFAAYLEAEMRLGRLARHDAEVVALSILGTLHSYSFNAYMLRERGDLVLPAHTFVRGLFRLLHRGLAATPAEDEAGREIAPKKARKTKPRGEG